MQEERTVNISCPLLILSVSSSWVHAKARRDANSPAWKRNQVQNASPYLFCVMVAPFRVIMEKTNNRAHFYFIGRTLILSATENSIEWHIADHWRKPLQKTPGEGDRRKLYSGITWCGRAEGGYPATRQPATSHCLDRGARDVQQPQMEVASGAQFVMLELPRSW